MQERMDYLYVILDTNGVCWAVNDGSTQRIDGLPSLFREGWRPVRETAYHIAAGGSYILILLERDMEPSKGFGFQT